jgi:hypothetical protein
MRGDIRVVPISAKEPKAVRIEAMSAIFENRQVYFPHEAPWLDECLREVLGFPSAKHDDVIDSIAQYLNWVRGEERSGFFDYFFPGGLSGALGARDTIEVLIPPFGHGFRWG